MYGISPSEKVDVNNIDVEYLEGLVFEKINEYRLSKGLNILELNESEINYSRKHSEKMVAEDGRLFHEHSSLGQPTDSVKIAVENVDGSIVSPIVIINYTELSNKIVQSWVKSPGHNKNLLNSKLTIGEIGLSYIIGEYVGVDGICRVYTTYKGWGY